MKTFLLVASLALAVALVTVLGGSRGKSRALETLAGEITTLSNQVAEAKTAVGEKDQALTTLQTKVRLHLDDLAAATNRLGSAQAEVARLHGALRGAEARAAERGAEVARLEQGLARAAEQAQRLKDGLRSLEDRVTQAQGQLARALEQMTNFASRLNLSAAEKARLLEQWHDPSALRAQSRQLAAKAPPPPPAAPPRAAAGAPEYPPKLVELLGRKPDASAQPKAKPVPQKLQLQPDGTVRLVPASGTNAPTQP